MTKIQEVLVNALPEIVKYAPTIASGLLHPASSIASYAISALSAMYSLDTHDLHSIASSIIGDTEKEKTLSSIEHEHKDIICSMINGIPKIKGAEITLKLHFIE